MRVVAQAGSIVAVRHQCRCLAVWNAAVWSIGNGLANTMLIIYLARELHSERLGLGIGLILAAPQVIGLLRLWAAAMIRRLGGRKRFCLGTFLGGALLLAMLPLVCTPGRLPSPGWSLTALVGLWCLYHLLQYLGSVALWSWLADAAQPRVRGRFLGRRARWIAAGTAVAMIDAGLFVWGMKQTWPDLPDWLPYGILATVGAGLMLAAIVPLALMPSLEGYDGQNPAALSECPRPQSFSRKQESGRIITHFPLFPPLSFLAPFRDTRFMRLLAFGCWFSLFNGLTQSAQNYFPVNVLGISLLASLSLQTGTSLGQWAVSPRVGRLADHFGNRPVMIVCQLLSAGGLLFFAAATGGNWLWLIGAWTLWIAYAGLNIGLPNLMLKLAPADNNVPHVAAFDAVRGLCYAAGTVVGGAMVDHCRCMSVTVGGQVLGFFTYLFLFGWAARSLGALLLTLVMEPSNKRGERKESTSK
jgi:MFS family permease